MALVRNAYIEINYPVNWGAWAISYSAWKDVDSRLKSILQVLNQHSIQI